jgi:hypothetical protein
MADIMARYTVVEKEDYDGIMCEQCGSGHNLEELLLCDKCDNGFHMKCVRPIVVSHISCENHCHIYRTPAAPSVGHRSHIAHNDVNVHHHIRHPGHYIRHQRLLLKPQQFLQVVCSMVDEADELHK